MSFARRARSEFLLLFLMLGLSGLPAWADWPPISPEDLKMTDLPEQKGAPAVILLREEVADEPNNNRTFYIRIKILTEAGRQLCGRRDSVFPAKFYDRWRQWPDRARGWVDRSLRRPRLRQDGGPGEDWPGRGVPGSCEVVYPPGCSSRQHHRLQVFPPLRRPLVLCTRVDHHPGLVSEAGHIQVHSVPGRPDHGARPGRARSSMDCLPAEKMARSRSGMASWCPAILPNAGPTSTSISP